MEGTRTVFKRLEVLINIPNLGFGNKKTAGWTDGLILRISLKGNQYRNEYQLVIDVPHKRVSCIGYKMDSTICELAERELFYPLEYRENIRCQDQA